MDKDQIDGTPKIAPPEAMGPRETFLVAMYGQLWNNINRHVLLVWQPVTTLGATLALLSLVEKKVFGLDIATSLAVIVATWLIVHTVDASNWFDRNQSMIGYIESVFLTEVDSTKLGPFVGKPRTRTRPILHFRIQSALGYAVMYLMLAHHFVQRIIPGFRLGAEPDFSKWIPYGCFLGSLAVIGSIRRKSQDD